MKKTLLILSTVVLFFAGCKKDTVFEEGEVLYSGSIRGYKYIDLGLPSGLKWAVCNVGASSPEDYGDYYAWGETETKSTYTSDNCSTCNLQMNDISGNSQYDVARKKWGSTWRIPKKSELEEIEDECTWTWTTQGDRNGYKVTGPNGNSIFLPAVGYHNGYDYQKCGYYRTSDCEMYNHNLYEPKFHFKENEFGVRIIVYPFNNERYWTDGYPVRAVMDK